MSKGVGQRPKLIRRPSPYLLLILTHHASLQQHSDTDGILTKWDTHWCKQTTQSISKQRVAFMVNHFLPFSLGSPHFFYPCLTVLKLCWGQNIRWFQPQLFYSFSRSTQHVSLPDEMCEMLLGSNYGLVKCYFSLPSECLYAETKWLTEKAYRDRHSMSTSSCLWKSKYGLKSFAVI